MAFQITYIFQAVDRFSKTAAKIEKSIAGIEKKVRRSTKGLRNFEKHGKKSLKTTALAAKKAERNFGNLNRRIKKSGVAMKFAAGVAGNLKFRLASLAVTMAMSGFGFAEGLRRSMDFQDVLLEMQALTGATGKDLESLKNTAFKFGKVFGTSIVEAMTGIKQTADAFPSLLKNIPGLAAMTKEAMVLSTAAGMTVPNSVKALNAVLNIFQKDAGKAKEVINMLAAGALLSNVMTEQLTESIIRGGGAARALGVSLPRAIALINAMGSAEIKQGKAGTALNMIMIKMGQHNVKIGDKSKKLSEIIGGLKKKYEDAGEGGIEFLRTLVTARHVKAIHAWFANIDKLDAWERGVVGTNEAYRQAEIRLTSLRKVFGRLGAVLSEKFWKVFEKFEPTLVRVTEKWVKFFDSISEGQIKAFGNQISSLIRTVDGLGTALTNLISPLTKAFEFSGKLDSDMESLAKKYPLMNLGLWSLIPKGGRPGEGTISKEGLEDLKIGGTEGSPGAKGRVSLDINLKGNTGAVSSLHAVSEGDVDVNTGQNLAFIG